MTRRSSSFQRSRTDPPTLTASDEATGSCG
jgi:hypothetical protein